MRNPAVQGNLSYLIPPFFVFILFKCGSFHSTFREGSHEWWWWEWLLFQNPCFKILDDVHRSNARSHVPHGVVHTQQGFSRQSLLVVVENSVWHLSTGGTYISKARTYRARGMISAIDLRCGQVGPLVHLPQPQPSQSTDN